MRRPGLLVAILTLAGNGLGLARDLALAALFGAGPATDAFLAAWTVPETTSPLLLEGLMALVGIPFLTRAVVAGRARDAIDRTFWPVMAVLVVLAIVVAGAASDIVALTVPGVADPLLAADCVRLAAPTIPLLGAAGYLAALLRAHGHQVTPAGVYLAYNVGIIATMMAGAQVWGVRAAAGGLSAGAAAMCLMLLPQAWSHAGGLPGWRRTRMRQWTRALGLAVPVLCYLTARQGQTYVERYFASLLQPGSISEFNFAQKVGQVPGTIALAIALAGFAGIARQVSLGRPEAAADAAVRALRTALAIVLPSAAGLAVLAAVVVPVLFERGSFDAAASAGTAAVLRVYVLGLPGQAMASVLVLVTAALGGSRWLPAAAAGAGLAVTWIVALLLHEPLGTPGIAAADAVGIWVTALILLRGIRPRLASATTGHTVGAVLRTAGVSLVAAAAAAAVLATGLGTDLVRLIAAAGGAALAGVLAARLLRADDILALVAGPRAMAHVWEARMTTRQGRGR